MLCSSRLIYTHTTALYCTLCLSSFTKWALCFWKKMKPKTHQCPPKTLPCLTASVCFCLCSTVELTYRIQSKLWAYCWEKAYQCWHTSSGDTPIILKYNWQTFSGKTIHGEDNAFMQSQWLFSRFAIACGHTVNHFWYEPDGHRQLMYNSPWGWFILLQHIPNRIG